MDTEIGDAPDLMEEAAPFRIEDAQVIEFIDVVEKIPLLCPEVFGHMFKRHPRLQQGSMRFGCPAGVLTTRKEFGKISLQELESGFGHSVTSYHIHTNHLVFRQMRRISCFPFRTGSDNDWHTKKSSAWELFVDIRAAPDAGACGACSRT